MIFSRVISPRILLPLGALVFALRCPAADFPTPHNSETTPGQPLPAEEAAAKWKLPPGFKVTVFAGEPEVQNPIACTWDPRGRLWIAENYTYAERTVKWDAKLRDRVIIFDDTDGDGRQDKRTVFAENIEHLTSIEVGLGGVWLMCPPQLLFIPDPDRDGVPDGPALVLLDGFTVPPENHHNFANGLRWGPDGWLYGRCGASAPGLVGLPGTAKEHRQPLSGGVWRYHPIRKAFETLCHGTTNPWGSDWNADGEMFFINTVNGHLWHMIPGAHFPRSHTIDPNPHVYELIEQHADHYHFDTGKGWTSSRDAGGGSDALGGGHAHCGAMIYQGDNWPESYRGKLMTLNFHGRRINVERLERKGSGYVGKHEPDIGFSADPFFRGIDLTCGPDGGVFILDWSDTGECHENTGVHRNSGRIYKITYGDPMKPAVQDLTNLATEELAKLHEHPNEWFVRMARRELAEPARVAGALERAVIAKARAAATDPKVRHQLLQTERAMGATYREELPIGILQDPSELIRSLAVDAAVETIVTNPADDLLGEPLSARLLGALTQLAKDESSALVRLHLASALGRIPPAARAPLAIALAQHGEDAADHNLPLLLWYGIEPLASEHADALVTIFAGSEIPTLRRLIVRRLAADIEGRGSALAQILSSAHTSQKTVDADILAGLTQGLTGCRKATKPASWDAFVARIGQSGPADLQTKVRELNVIFGSGRALDEVKKLALDDKAELEARKAALRSLIEARPDDLRTICEKLVGVRFLNTVAARGLALFDDPRVGQKLAKHYASFHPSERAHAIDTLVSRAAFANALLAEVAEGRIAREDITAYHARQIRNLGDDAVTKRLGDVWGEMRETTADKHALIAKLKATLTPDALTKADKGAGRQIFAQSCATCHVLYGEGGQIGPDLTGSGRANLDYLLENIVDPGAVVTADFRLNLLTMKDGRVLNGIVAAKTDRTLTFKTITDTQTIQRAEIAKQEELAQSLMPEGLLAAYRDEQILNLIAYLMHPNQVPLHSEK